AAIVGAGALLRIRRNALALMLAGPIAMALLPAALHRYPFDGARLTVYLTPCVLLLAIFGFKAIAEWVFVADSTGGPPVALQPEHGRAIHPTSLSRVRYVALLPLAYVIGVNVFWCGYHLVIPRTRGHL